MKPGQVANNEGRPPLPPQLWLICPHLAPLVELEFYAIGPENSVAPEPSPLQSIDFGIGPRADHRIGANLMIILMPDPVATRKIRTP